MRVLSRARSSPWSCPVRRERAAPSGRSGTCSTGVRSSPAAFQWVTACAVSSSSAWPMASSRVRQPSAARYSLTSSAMNSKKLTTNSGRPVNRLRSSGFCVATPTGQVSRWQTRIMTQPDTTSGALAKPNSSAPRRAAMMTSRPVLSWPSACTTIRSRNPLRSRVCCVSARPISHGAHTHLGDELDVDPGGRVGVLQVVDELGEILDRVDVVVRRWRDQADAGGGEAGLRDPRVHLVPGQLPALPRLGSLRHLDLQVVGVDQVLAGYPEPAARHLLD